jgi:hypothetical protein
VDRRLRGSQVKSESFPEDTICPTWNRTPVSHSFGYSSVTILTELFYTRSSVIYCCCVGFEALRVVAMRNSVCPGESQATFLRNISPPSLGLNNNPSKKPAVIYACFTLPVWVILLS